MKATLETWHKQYSQEGDCIAGSEHQLLTVSQHDGGGGPFWVLTTERWAFDSIEELVTLLKGAGVAETASEGDVDSFVDAFVK